MNLENIRLECIKIAASIGGSPDELIAIAKRLFCFVIGSSQ